jgi:hypothetical protein
VTEFASGEFSRRWNSRRTTRCAMLAVATPICFVWLSRLCNTAWASYLRLKNASNSNENSWVFHFRSVGVVQRLALDSESFSKIACTSVLLPLGSEEAAALKEIARVARPQARIWPGKFQPRTSFLGSARTKGIPLQDFSGISCDEKD